MHEVSKAISHLENADGYNLESAIYEVAKAQAWAAIAQAQAMQLLAKRFEQFMDSQGVGPEMIEAAERGIRLAKENQRLARRIAELEGAPSGLPVESEFSGNEQ